MKLPYCRCGAKSRLVSHRTAGWELACTECDHRVVGHARIEAALKAFLWKHTNGATGHVNPDELACGCPASGCVHPFFESTEAKAS